MKHAELQAAIKDVNEHLDPTPKLKFISSAEAMKADIIRVVAVAAEVDDPRIDNLKPGTVELYNSLISSGTETLVDVPEEPETVQPGAEASPADKAETEIPNEAQTEASPDCFGVSYNPESPAECCNQNDCGQFNECMAIVTGKTKKKKKGKEKKEKSETAPKKKKKEQPSAYSYLDAFKEAVTTLGPATHKDIIDKVWALYLAGGGSPTSSWQQAERNVDTFLRPLLGMGYFKKENDLISPV